MIYGHRNDPRGYAGALAAFERAPAGTARRAAADDV